MLSLNDLGRDWCARVRARQSICDSPLAVDDCSVRQGSSGSVCDVDHCNGVVFVDFGTGAIACSPDELEADSSRRVG